VNILEFEILDMPDYMTVTNITPVGRFEDGTVDGISGETELGSFYFLGYDFVTSIEPDTGAILEIEVEFNNTLTNPSVVFMINEISAGDANANPLVAVADNFGQFSGDMVGIDLNDGMPANFALHPNYPNPFNPSTFISYDIPISSNVSLNIYDMRGRMVKHLVRQNQDPGRYLVKWHGNDNSGNNVSAGVYIYRLNTGNNVFSQKMILMK
jgi:hypothetical protein